MTAQSNFDPMTAMFFGTRERVKDALDAGRQDFSGVIFTEKISLAGMNFTRVCFRDAHFTRANLTDVNLTDADFTDAEVTGTNLVGANLTGACFYRASLRWNDFRATLLLGVNFKDAHLEFSTFDPENIPFVEASGCRQVYPGTPGRQRTYSLYGIQ